MFTLRADICLLGCRLVGAGCICSDRRNGLCQASLLLCDAFSPAIALQRGPLHGTPATREDLAPRVGEQSAHRPTELSPPYLPLCTHAITGVGLLRFALLFIG